MAAKEIRLVSVCIEVSADTDEEAKQYVRECLVRGMSPQVAQVVTRDVVGVRPEPWTLMDLPLKS